MDVQSLIDVAGGVAELGARLGVARTTIIGWRKDNTIPANRVAQIATEFRLPVGDVVEMASVPKSERSAA